MHESRSPRTAGATSADVGRPAGPESVGRYAPTAGERQIHVPLVREPPPSADGEPAVGCSAPLHRVAAMNVRRHILRATARVGILLSVDVAAFAMLRAAHWRSGMRALVGPTTIANADFLPGRPYGSWQFVVALMLALAVTGNYGPGDRRHDPGRVLAGCALAAALPIWPAFWAQPVHVSAGFAYAAVVLSLAVFTARALLDRLVRHGRQRARSAARTVLVGQGADCISVLGRRVVSAENGFDVVGFVDVGATLSETALGGLGELQRVLDEYRADTIIVCGQLDADEMARVVKAAMIAECELLAGGPAFEIAGVCPKVIWRRGLPLIELRAEAVRGRRLILKRVFDLVVSGTALVVLAPLMLAITIAIRLESPGPAVFAQRRPGRHGRYFHCLKFRSMCANAEEILRSDPQLYEQYLLNDCKLPEAIDTRITRVGRFLRKTSLDELPQLWNVLRGDMSLVGPRPVLPEELRHYGDEEPMLLLVRPGVTGLWQVNGRSTVTYPARKQMELEYVQTWSLARDVGILLRTVPAVLMQRGAH